MKISIDIGYGHVKAVTKDTKIIFPSVIADSIHSDSSPVIGQMDNYFVSYADKTKKALGNQRYAYVGDAGITNNGIRRWEGKEKLDSEEIKILVATATSAVMYKEKESINEPIDVCVGLPMSYFVNKNIQKELLEILTDLEGIISLNGQEPINISFSSVKIYAQSAGAYYAAICDLEGKIKNQNYVTQPIGEIDIGFRTVDYLYIGLSAQGPVSIPKYSGSLEESGMNAAFQIAAELASKDNNKTIKPETIEKVLLRKIYGGKIPGTNSLVKPYWDNACKKLAQSIVSEIKRVWGDAINELATVIITGGGGKDLFSYIKEALPKAELQEDPSFANATGYLIAQRLDEMMKKAN